jgi:hypothetical protein
MRACCEKITEGDLGSRVLTSRQSRYHVSFLNVLVHWFKGAHLETGVARPSGKMLCHRIVSLVVNFLKSVVTNRSQKHLRSTVRLNLRDKYRYPSWRIVLKGLIVIYV